MSCRASVVLLLPFLAGCTGTPDAEDPPSATDSATATQCLWMPEAQTVTLVVRPGAHYIETPAGSSFDGRFHEFSFQDSTDRLAALEVTAKWPPHPANTDLRLGIENPNAQRFEDYWAYGPVNGASPLVISVEEPDPQRLGQRLTVEVGTSRDPPLVLPATVAVVEQRVDIVVQETYHC